MESMVDFYFLVVLFKTSKHFQIKGGEISSPNATWSVRPKCSLVCKNTAKMWGNLVKPGEKGVFWEKTLPRGPPRAPGHRPGWPQAWLANKTKIKIKINIRVKWKASLYI